MGSSVSRETEHAIQPIAEGRHDYLCGALTRGEAFVVTGAVGGVVTAGACQVSVAPARMLGATGCVYAALTTSGPRVLRVSPPNPLTATGKATINAAATAPSTAAACLLRARPSACLNIIEFVPLSSRSPVRLFAWGQRYPSIRRQESGVSLRSEISRTVQLSKDVHRRGGLR